MAREFHPVRIDEVQDIVRKLNTHNRALPEEKKVHLRAIGHGRTWSSVFLDDNDWLLYTSFLVMDDNSAVRPVFQENGEYKKVGNRHLVQVSACFAKLWLMHPSSACIFLYCIPVLTPHRLHKAESGSHSQEHFGFSHV